MPTPGAALSLAGALIWPLLALTLTLCAQNCWQDQPPRVWMPSHRMTKRSCALSFDPRMLTMMRCGTTSSAPATMCFFDSSNMAAVAQSRAPRRSKTARQQRVQCAPHLKGMVGAGGLRGESLARGDESDGWSRHDGAAGGRVLAVLAADGRRTLVSIRRRASMTALSVRLGSNRSDSRTRRVSGLQERVSIPKPHMVRNDYILFISILLSYACICTMPILQNT